MKQASGWLKNRLASDVTALCRILKISRTDGVNLYLTDADNDVIFGGNTYKADSTFMCSAISFSTTDKESQSVTLEIMMTDDGLKEDDVRGRRYAGAIAEVSVIDYEFPQFGAIKHFRGLVGGILIRRATAVIEVGPLSMHRAPTVGYESFSPSCRASLGDGRCQFVFASLHKVAFTVSTFVGKVVTMTADPGVAANFYAFGFIEWVTGNNAGLVSKVTASAGAALTIGEQPPTPFVNGDTGIVYSGCDKIITTCRDKFSNVVNFRGEPDVPTGQDTNQRKTTVAIPRTGNTLG